MHIIMLPVIPDYPCLYPYLLASTPTSLPLPLSLLPPCLFPCPYYLLASSPVLTTSLPLLLSLLPPCLFPCPYYPLASSPVLTTSLPLPLSLLPPCLFPCPYYLLASSPVLTTSLPLPLSLLPPCLFPCPYYLLAYSPVLTTSLPLPLSLLPIYASSPLPLSLLSFLPLCHFSFLLTASPIHHRFLVYLGDLCVSKGQPLQQVQMMVCKIVLEEPYCDVLIRIRYGLPATPVH